MSKDALELAFICSGNRFRSPLAAALLAAERPDLSLRIASFGTLDLGAAPALPEAVQMARSFGVDLSMHRARSLAGADLASFDLVIGFERHHIAAAVVEAGASSERTFSLPELVDLLETEQGAVSSAEPFKRARLRIRAAHATRAPGFRSRMPELEDPLGRPPATQRRIAEEVRASISALGRRLFD